MLTLDELRADVEAGRIDTVVLAIRTCRAGSRASASTRGTSLDEIAEHRAEGCNYLLGVDVDMNTAPGYAMTCWERGYGDFVLAPDLVDAARRPWHEGTALVLCDLRLARRHAGRRHRRVRSCAASSTRLARARLAGDGRHRARVHPVPRHLRGGAGAGYRGLTPANQYNVDYSHPRHARSSSTCCGAIRSDMRAPGLRSSRLQGRVQPRPARDQLPLRRRAADGRRPQVYKTGAKEIARQEGTASPSWRSTTSARATRATSTARSGTATASLFPAGDGDGLSPLDEHFLAGQLARTARATLFFAPNVNSYKRYAHGSFAPDRGGLGCTTTARARSGSSATARRCGSRAACRAATSTRTWRSPRSRRRAARHRARARARARVRGQRVRRPTLPRVPSTCARRPALEPRSRSPARRSATTSSTTTRTRRASSRGLRRGRHRLGAAPGFERL